MGAWSEGMQANDTALDAIDHYRNCRLQINKKGKDILFGKKPLLDVLQLAQCRNTWDPNLSVLGLAEFFFDRKTLVDVKCRKFILLAIERELSLTRLNTWVSPKERKGALLRFKNRLLGKKVDLKKVSQDNEGLLSKICRCRG